MGNFEQLKARFPDLQPISGAPTLMRINGCGFAAYGRRDKDEQTGTYLTTYVFTIAFIPVFALTAYRVADAPSGGQYYFGTEALSGFAKGWNWLLAALLGCCGLVVAIGALAGPSHGVR